MIPIIITMITYYDEHHDDYHDLYQHLPSIFIPFTINHHTILYCAVMTNCLERNHGLIMLTHQNVVYQSTHGMINLHMVWPFCQYCNRIIIISIIISIIIIIWFSYHRRLALHYHQSWSMANDRTMDPYRPITTHPSMIDTAIRWKNNRWITI